MKRCTQNRESARGRKARMAFQAQRVRYSGMVGIFCICVLLVGSARAGSDGMNGPWKWGTPETGPPQAPTDDINPGIFLVRLFRTYVSPIDGRHCPMYPSCSQYGLQCFKDHGFFVGMAMTWDRLYRCGRDELRYCPKIVLDNGIKCYDPVAHNAFWWHK